MSIKGLKDDAYSAYFIAKIYQQERTRLKANERKFSAVGRPAESLQILGKHNLTFMALYGGI